MPPRIPLLLRLRRGAVDRRDGLERLVLRVVRPRSAWLAWVVHRYAFRNDELAFARNVLANTQWWLYRSDQAGSCGDFALVDLSAPRPGDRAVWVLDLKQGAPLREGGGGCGVQLRFADRARHALATAGVVGPAAPIHRLTGDARDVLTFLCARER